jgi:hypothetical protein
MSIPVIHGDSINRGPGGQPAGLRKMTHFSGGQDQGYAHTLKYGEEGLITASNQHHVIFLKYSRYIAVSEIYWFLPCHEVAFVCGLGVSSNNPILVAILSSFRK